MKNYNLGRQECRNLAVFDGFHAVFGVLCSVVSLRQALSDKLLGKNFQTIYGFILYR